MLVSFGQMNQNFRAVSSLLDPPFARCMYSERGSEKEEKKSLDE
jgi:hypothetical protein